MDFAEDIMKKILLLLLAAGFCFETLFSAPLGIGGDTVEPAAVQNTTAIKNNAEIRALEFYIAGLLEKDPGKKIPLLLESVKLDPSRRLPLQVVIKLLEKVPASIPLAKKELDKIRKNDPRNVFLARCSVKVDTFAGCTPAEIVKSIRPALEKKPSKKEYPDFRLLVLDYVDLQLNTFTAPEKLPFEADNTEFKENALFYYALAAKREKLSQSGDFAQKMHKKYLSELAQADLSANRSLKRHVTFLHGAKEFEAAFQAVSREIKKRQDPVVKVLYLEAAVQAGKPDIVEKELKKYPKAPVQFCALKRFQSCLAAGDLRRAREELANMPATPERLDKQLQIAQQMRDIPEMKKILSAMEVAHGKNKHIPALGYLSLAEIAKDPSALAKAEKMLGQSYLQSPGLANAVAYVSVVLGKNLSRAEMLLEYALSKEPYNAAYLDSMAWLKYKKGDYKTALEYMKKVFRCIDYRTGGAVVSEHAGDIYLALGDKKTAQKYYQMALDFYQKNKQLNADFDPAALRKKLIKK